MADETFPHEESGIVVVPQERILLPSEETNETIWPVQEIRFNKNNCILIVDVDELGLVERMVDEPLLSEFSDLGFQPKKGLHMTVVGYENGRQIGDALEPLSAEEQETLVLEITGMAASMDWSWCPAGELQPFRGRRAKGLKIISRVECPAFNDFYDGLGQLMPTARFKLYPPHITLLKRPGAGEAIKKASLSVGGVALNRPILNLSYPTIEG